MAIYIVFNVRTVFFQFKNNTNMPAMVIIYNDRYNYFIAKPTLIKPNSQQKFATHVYSEEIMIKAKFSDDTIITYGLYAIIGPNLLTKNIEKYEINKDEIIPLDK